MAETCAAYDLPREMLTMRAAHSGRVQAARRQLVAALRNPPYALGLDRIADVLGMSRPTARRYAAMADAAAPPPVPSKKPDEVVAEICGEQGIRVDELAAPKAVRARVLVTARLRQEPYRMSLAEVGAYFGMGIKAVANYTAIAKDEGLLPPEQIYTGRRKSRQAARA
jgi:AraC-like DNA-binding protein